MSAVPPLDVAIVRDRYTSNPMICFTCHGLLIRPHETIEESTPAAYDFKTIAQSASDGCLICKIYHLDLMRDNAPEQLSLTGSVSFVSGSALESESDKMVAKYLHLHTDTDNGPQRVSIPLLSALSCDSNSQAQNDCSLFPATFPVQTPIEAINTGDNRCLEMVASWLQTCRLNHQDCNANLSHTYSIIRPTRVIDASATMVRLVSNVDWASDQFPSYITVSHKWRSTGMIKLLKSNLEGMHRGFQEQALPAVFRDAIILARALKIRYVWIDALCIVQDDPDELQNEISNMGHIYRNAVLNVGALQAAEVEMKEEQESPGLFADRDPQAISPFALTIQRSDYTRNHFAYQDVVLEKLNWSSLMKCGWVLQERLLSRRSIYFGDRLWWECSENLACEGFPGRLPEFYKDGFWPGKNTPYRIINMLRRAGQDGRYEHSSPAGWHDLVSTFSGCNLSFEQDYLVALSGLAHEFQVTLGDEYYAGLWGQNLCDGLLWHRNTSHYNDDGVRPKEYRAPSWSWASFNGRICSALSYDSQPQFIAEVLEVSTTSVGSDPTGRISGGYLRISGHLRPNRRPLSKKYTRHVETWWLDRLSVQYEWFEEGYRSDGSRPMHSCFFLLLAHNKSKFRRTDHGYIWAEHEDQGNSEIDSSLYVDIGYVYGLILEVVDLEKSMYRRIGAFKHM